jgi:hypothetical protein
VNISKIISITLVIILFAQLVTANSVGETLIDGIGIFVTTGEKWDFYQGYSITVKSVNQETKQAWIILSQDGVVIQENILAEGQNLVYSQDHEILNLTLDTIYSNSGGGLVTFKPVYQFRDLNLPAPVFENDNGTSVDNGDDKNNNSATQNIPGFESMLVFVALICATYSNQKKGR